MKKKQQLTKRGYFKKYRERIFRNNQVILSKNEQAMFADEEIVNALGTDYEYSIVDIDIYDPYISVRAVFNKKSYIGYSKRMPNDVPNDRIGIQVAVSRLIKRLKNV